MQVYRIQILAPNDEGVGPDEVKLEYFFEDYDAGCISHTVLEGAVREMNSKHGFDWFINELKVINLVDDTVFFMT